MRFTSLLATLSSITLALCAAPGEDAEPPCPGLRVVLDTPAIDFGIVAAGSGHERVVRISNLTGLSITLLSTDSDCTCLSASMASRALAPGERTQWRVVLDTCDYLGEVRRHVWLKTDHPESTRLKLPVRYRVVPELFTEPGFVSLGLPGSKLIEAEIAVRTLSEQPIHLMAAACSDPGVVVDLPDEPVTRTRPARVRIRVYAPLPEGRFQSTVFVETTSAEVPRLRIPLLGESVAGLDCDRREVVFDAVRLGTSCTQTVTFSRDPDVRVGAVRTSNEALDVQAVRREAGRVAVILRSNVHLPLGSFRGYLILEVNNGRARKIKLPYHGRVVEPARKTPRDQPRGGKPDSHAAGS